jgi:hypothetical protein
VVNHGAHKVGRQEVRGELETGKRGVERTGERLDGERLGKAGDAFEEDVAVAEQADEQPVHQGFLADEDAGHFLFHGGNPGAGFRDLFLEKLGSHEFVRPA